jgi:hypothetical protein
MTCKGDDGLWRYDGSSLLGILDAVWKGVTLWYAEGLQLHPTVFLCSPSHWRKVLTEAAAPENKQGTIGIQEVMTPEQGKRNALIVVGPICGGWMFFAEPGLKDTIQVLNKDWVKIGEIVAW